MAILTVVAILATACADDAPAVPAAAATATAPTSTTSSTSTAPTSTAPTSTAPTTTVTLPAGAPQVRLVAIGDSYSAGIGAATKDEAVTKSCTRDTAASIGTLAAARLRTRGVAVQLDLRACSGGTIAQVVAQAADVRDADAISVTLGGNDLGFSKIISECLLRGCKSYDQATDQLPGITPDTEQDDWTVLDARLVSALAELRTRLAPGGRVYLLTYPIPFPAEPDATCLQNSAPFDDTNRVLVNAATERLDRALVDAADAANRAAGAPFVDVVEWRTGLDAPRRRVTDAAGIVRDVRDDPNGICSPEPFVNGIASTGLGDSFHPTDRGHSYAADALVRAIQARVGR